MKLIENTEFGSLLEAAVAQQVSSILSDYLPATVDEVILFLKFYRVQYRVDFRRGGQDCSVSRVNVKTDGKGTVKSLNVG